MGFDKELFAARLRGKRAEADLSQIELATKAGVNKDTVAKYEAAARIPSTETLVKLAEALGCTPDNLLGWPDAA